MELKNIEEIDKFIDENEMSFFYISQPNCGVCQALLPKVKSLLDNYPKIYSAYINALEIQTVAEKFSVFTVPVLLLFVDGKEYLRRARIVSIDELDDSIGKIYQLYYS